MGGNADIIDDFRNYKKEYSEKNDVPIADEFSIHQQAVKKNAKVYKSILKLDKNFHIYIHGNRDMIDKGYDEERGLHFYKCFYRTEE